MTDYPTPPPPPGPPGGSFPPPPPPPPGGGYPPPGGGFPPPPGSGGFGGPSGGGQQNGFGIGALVTGILSILTCCCGFVGLPLGIAGVVLGYLGMQKAQRGEASNKPLALAGLITGGVGVLLGITWFILWIVSPETVDWEQFQELQQQN